MKPFKSCEVCRDEGEQLNFCKSEYRHIFYLNDIVNFYAIDGKWRSAHQHWEHSISI